MFAQEVLVYYYLGKDIYENLQMIHLVNLWQILFVDGFIDISECP